MIYTLDEIKTIIAPIAQKYRIPRVYLFGSYARGTATENSDLDFIIDTAGTGLKSLLSLSALYMELEETFQKSIDLVTINSLKQPAQMPSEISFRNTVQEEMVSLYDVA